MGIVEIPPELTLDEPIDCAICSVRLALTGATAGQHNGRGCQLFACVSHFMEIELLILGWADVVIRERDEGREIARQPRTLLSEQGGPDVRPNP